jgi:hypothetical protein
MHPDSEAEVRQESLSSEEGLSSGDSSSPPLSFDLVIEEIN